MKKQKKSHSSKKKEATVNGKKIWLRLAPGLVAVAVAMFTTSLFFSSVNFSYLC